MQSQNRTFSMTARLGDLLTLPRVGPCVIPRDLIKNNLTES